MTVVVVVVAGMGREGGYRDLVSPLSLLMGKVEFGSWLLSLEGREAAWSSSSQKVAAGFLQEIHDGPSVGSGWCWVTGGVDGAVTALG